MIAEHSALKYTVSTLGNGMRVVTCEMPWMESVALGLWVGIGGRYEEKAVNGISHFLEHILFKGTKRRSAKQLSQAIESVGGSLNGFTGEECTCYMAKVRHQHLKRAAEVLADMHLNPAVRPGDVEKERAVIREEINMYRDTPQHHVLDLFNEAFWKNHPLGRPLAGTPDTISALSRDDLLKFHARNYTPLNTVCAAAGRVTHEEAVAVAAGLFPGAARAPLPSFLPACPPRRQPELLAQRKGTEQTHFCLGVRGYAREHPDRYALNLMSIALGENMSSRLFQRIREKHGLAYAIHSSVARYRDAGAFTVYAGVENKNTRRAIALIMKELAAVKREGIRKVELSHAKEYWIGQLSMELEKTMNNMLTIGESLLCSGRILTKGEILSKIAEVRLEDVQRVASDVFANAGLGMAAIGPLPEQDRELLDMLHF